MRNFIIDLFVIVALLFFSRCSNDDKIEPSFSLIGKTYAAEAYEDLFDDGYDYWVYRFLNETEVERTTRKLSPTGGIIGNAEITTYTLNYPALIIKSTMSESYISCEFINEKTFRYQGAYKLYEYQLIEKK